MHLSVDDARKPRSAGWSEWANSCALLQPLRAAAHPSAGCAAAQRRTPPRRRAFLRGGGESDPLRYPAERLSTRALASDQARPELVPTVERGDLDLFMFPARTQKRAVRVVAGTGTRRSEHGGLFTAARVAPGALSDRRRAAAAGPARAAYRAKRRRPGGAGPACGSTSTPLMPAGWGRPVPGPPAGRSRTGRGGSEGRGRFGRARALQVHTVLPGGKWSFWL